jgi:nifR3 family TIM-barrel protein
MGGTRRSADVPPAAERLKSMLIRPVQFDPVVIDFPVALAALSGYSDWPTRVIARRLGAGYTFGEVLLDQFVLNVTKGRKATRFIRITDDDHPTAAQLMGGDSEALVPAALKLVEAGFDWIDVNFGCPVKKVLGKCRGGYLLGHPDSALGLLKRVRDALPPRVPLTVKMRRGTDDSQLARDNFYAIFDGAFQLGVAAITVHPRTVRQRYEGPSSWEFLEEVKRHAGSRIVVGSGDLFTAADCLDMVRRTGVDGVTVARGAIGNPWIFRETRALAAGRPLPDPPGLAEQREVIAEHFRLAEEVYGGERAGSLMRKVCIKYARLHPQPDQVRDAFVKVQGRRQWEELLARWYTDRL